MTVAVHVNANNLFKAKYPKYVRNALLGAIIFHVALFVLSPPFTFKPYQLKEEQFEVIDIPDDIELPPPPKAIEQPQVEIQAADDAEETDEELPETTFDDLEDMPPPPPSSGDMSQFFAFDEPPVLKHFEVPDYPDLAREAGIEGTVRIRVLVDESGKVISADVVSSDVTDAMARAAVVAARKCRFSPAKQRTKPVKAMVMIPFNFRLN